MSRIAETYDKTIILIIHFLGFNTSPSLASQWFGPLVTHPPTRPLAQLVPLTATYSVTELSKFGTE